MQRWLEMAFYLDLASIWALVLTLARNGLYRTYRFLFAYLLLDGCHGAAALILRNGTQAYFLVYLAAQSLKTVLAVFVILELAQIVLAEHPALARFGRDVVAYVLLGAAVIAGAGIAVDSSVPPGRSPILHRFNSVERTMDIWLLMFLLVMALFLTWFPVRLKRNVVLYFAGFIIYFLTRAAGLLLTNLEPVLMSRIDTAMLSVSFLCLLTWTFAFRRKGEKTTVVLGHRWDPDAMNRLNTQLSAINTRLLRLSRR